MMMMTIIIITKLVTLNNFFLTQHFAELGIVQVRILNRQPFALIFGPNHERVHGSSDPRLRRLFPGIPVRTMPVGSVSVSRRTLEGLRPRRVRADESSHLRALLCKLAMRVSQRSCVLTVG